MDFFTKNRLSILLIILLLIFNICMLTTIWVLHFNKKMPFGPPNPHHGQRDTLDILKNKLDLTEEQVEKTKKMRKDHFAEIHKIDEKLHKLKDSIIPETFNNSDSAKLDKIAVEIGKYETEKERLRYKHFIELKKIFTPDQNKKFMDFMSEIAKNSLPPLPPYGDVPPGMRHPPGPPMP